MVTDLSPTFSIKTTQRKKKVIKNHHKGPIPEGYITSPRKRQKTYSKRVKSLFTQGYRLHSMCGAKIKIEITNELGKIRSMSMPPFMTRSVMQQAGESAINVKPVPEITEPLAPVEGTPKKRPMLIKQSSNNKTIKNLPGEKKGKENALSPNMKRVRNKCSICKIIFDSAADKAFKKKNGGKKAVWLGCDVDECHFWAHAMCVQVDVPTLKKVRTIKFVCPEHKAPSSDD